MIFSERKRFIFFAAGKTGTTSMERALAEYADEIPFDYDREVFDRHIPPEYARAQLPDDVWNSYFKFAFVRNPWDWVISFYLFTWPAIYAPYKQSIWTRPRYYYEVWNRNRGRFDERAFKLFWEHMKRLRRGIDSDNRYQHRFLSDADGRLLVDYVGRYERLQCDFDRACNVIGVPRRTLKILNRGRYRRSKRSVSKDYTDFYTPAASALVRRHYARDIREFGYRYGD